LCSSMCQVKRSGCCGGVTDVSCTSACSSSGASAASCLRRSLADVVEIDPSHRDFRRILMFRFCIWRGFGDAVRWC
jgi:hypothetical protein